MLGRRNGPRRANLRRVLRIRGKLLLAYLLPAIVLLATFGVLAHGAMRSSMEAELGARLTSIAQAAAGQLDGALVDGVRRAFAEEGDLEVRRSRTYEYLRLRLLALRRSTGVRGASIFDLGDGAGALGEIRNLVEDTGQIAVGERSYTREADRQELERVFRDGEGRASVLFRGKDGVPYKSGYAPIKLGQRVIAAIAIDGPAEFFTALARLRDTLLAVGGGLVVALALLSIGLAQRLSRPVRGLADAARAIGRGDLRTPIRAETRDEVGVLAQTMEEMRKQIDARERELQMMLAGIAHEVRNPLGGIELYAGLLREDVANDPKQLQRVRKIERELAHLKSIVTDFLDYARKAPLELAPLETQPLFADLASLIAGEAEAQGVRVEIAVEPGAERVMADADKLRRALLNLVRNALQAMPEGGALLLSAKPRASLDSGSGAEPAERDGSWDLAIVVRDTGQGMPADVARDAFTPFFTTRERGSGLGLAFVKRIAEEHGGDAVINSAPGEGTRVTLFLRSPPREFA